MSKSVSKAINMDNSFDEDEKLDFISRKIWKMWKNKSGSRWKISFKKVFKEKKDKEKRLIICHECKKLGHFKSECLKLEKSKEKYKDMKSLIGTWDLNDTTFDEEAKEEANLCSMADTTFEEWESEQEEVDLNEPKSLKKVYHELLSNSSILS